MYMCLHLSLSLYIYIYMHTYIHVYVNLYMYMYMYTYVHIITLYICVYIHMYTYVCIYIYIYIYIYRSEQSVGRGSEPSNVRVQRLTCPLLLAQCRTTPNRPTKITPTNVGDPLWAWEFHPFRLRLCSSQTLWNPQCQ